MRFGFPIMAGTAKCSRCGLIARSLADGIPEGWEKDDQFVLCRECSIDYTEWKDEKKEPRP